MKKEKIPYIRIATSYYRIVEKPLLSGDTTSINLPWNIQTIVADEGKDYLSKIPKLLGYCCIPSHIDYQPIVDDFYNTYHELPFEPLKIKNNKELKLNELITTYAFLRHIFGDQLELGLDYLKILYLYPTQILPILCLVSKERATGKSTFIKWIKAIFGLNMTYIKGDSLPFQNK